MKKSKCKHCGKETSPDYREYYNPTAGLWGVTACTKCGEVDSIEDVRPGFSNLATRHRWYRPILIVASVVIVGFCVGAISDYTLDRGLRITLGIVAFLVPGFYGVLRGNPGERTTATTKEELQGLLKGKRKQEESSSDSL